MPNRTPNLQVAIGAALADKQREADEREPSQIERELVERGRRLRAFQGGEAA